MWISGYTKKINLDHVEQIIIKSDMNRSDLRPTAVQTRIYAKIGDSQEVIWFGTVGDSDNDEHTLQRSLEFSRAWEALNKLLNVVDLHAVVGNMPDLKTG